MTERMKSRVKSAFIHAFGDEATTIELSKLINQFLQADDSNSMTATVAGKRKREQGLVVPSTFKCFSLNKNFLKFFRRS